MSKRDKKRFVRLSIGHTNISMTLKVYRRGVERVKALSISI